MPEPPTIEELQDLIDGRLDGPRLREVHAYLAQDADTAQLVQRMRQTDAELRRMGQGMLHDSQWQESKGARAGWAKNGQSGVAGLWGELPVKGRKPETSKPAPRRAMAAAMAGCLLLAAGAGGGWWARVSYGDPHGNASRVDAFLGEVAYTYDYMRSGGLDGLDFAADQQQRWREWSSQAFGRSIDPPDLKEFGYEFVGARIAPYGGRNGSVLAYRGEDDTTISVYCWKDDGALAGMPKRNTLNGYQINVASGSGYGVAVIGPEGHESLDPATRSVSSDFNKLFAEG